MQVAILGLGEAGTLYAAGFAAAGVELTGFDPADVPTPVGVRRCADIAEAVDGAELVLGLTVIGSVPAHGAATALVVSGAGATVVQKAFAPLGAPVDVVSDRAGDAARRKLLRSLFMKSLGATIVEALAAGEAAGDLDWVRGQIAAELNDGIIGMDRRADGTAKHGERRGHEARAAAQMAAELGVTPTVIRAAADVHLGLARTAGRLEDSLLAAYEGLATANIGDARQRLGLLDSGIRPMWPGAAVVGRAHTVFCRAGENVGLIESLETAQPGDVLVVD